MTQLTEQFNKMKVEILTTKVSSKNPVYYIKIDSFIEWLYESSIAMKDENRKDVLNDAVNTLVAFKMKLQP